MVVKQVKNPNPHVRTLRDDWRTVDMDREIDALVDGMVSDSRERAEWSHIRRNIALARDGRDANGLIPASVLAYHNAV